VTVSAKTGLHSSTGGKATPRAGVSSTRSPRASAPSTPATATATAAAASSSSPNYKGATASTLLKSCGPFYSVAYSEGGRYAFAGGFDGTAAVFDVVEKKLLHRFVLSFLPFNCFQFRFTLLCGAISGIFVEGSKVYAAGSDGKVYILEVPDVKKLMEQNKEQLVATLLGGCAEKK